jgi:hypothetical protein
MRRLNRQDATATWTYATAATPRIQNNTLANRIDVVCGQAQGIHVSHFCDVSTGAAVTPNIAINVNNTYPTSTTAGLGTQLASNRRGMNANMLNVIEGIGIATSHTCSGGFTTFMAIEALNVAVTITFYGATANQGICASWQC